mmetsp:Transcript_16974/g.32130  ORF Transcript_16974/g.32130 Transcript_16974/m.32130 type:complete len:389 (-) Transcript_16974:519-1685(-)|eukprot:CAMPEP_0176496934 /NCGR_PEP_ID=MMETSP0200_2-20121128/11453_1 /TAXON_ID=947934 /ORGANISM="Chaetoceros sp., Strain GSL56" /LENGTH=388 /DNA_ID=CAMNT_0017894909 /DNA_START=361 /DNA_END=1527 /DNA_ORIENTATION=+
MVDAGNIGEASDDIAIRCRVRTLRDNSVLSPSEGSSWLYDDDDGQNMICKMHQCGPTPIHSWNLWDGIVPFESTDCDSEGGTPNVLNESMESKNVGGMCEHGQRLEFCPVFVPLHSRPSSRIGSRLTSLRRLPASASNDSLMDCIPSDSIVGGVQRQQVQYPVRSGSPTNRFDFTAASVSQRIRSSPMRDTSEIAAACFAVGDDVQRETQLEPFDVLLTDIVSVQNHGRSHGNSNVGVIVISTRKYGSLEVIPGSVHARDLLLAFLQATVPKGILEDDCTMVNSKMILSKPSSQSFDMQDFEEDAVEKTFANETFWNRMARKSAIFAVRFKELCICCDNEVEVNDLIYKSDHQDDVECCNSTVESVLSEMELDTLAQDDAFYECHFHQ